MPVVGLMRIVRTAMEALLSCRVRSVVTRSPLTWSAGRAITLRRWPGDKLTRPARFRRGSRSRAEAACDQRVTMWRYRLAICVLLGLCLGALADCASEAVAAPQAMHARALRPGKAPDPQVYGAALRPR